MDINPRILFCILCNNDTKKNCKKVVVFTCTCKIEGVKSRETIFEIRKIEHFTCIQCRITIHMLHLHVHVEIDFISLISEC